MCLSGPSFLGIVQLYRNKAAKMLKAKVVIEYPAYVMHLNFSSHLHTLLINNRRTVVGFLPVGVEESGSALLGMVLLQFRGLLPAPLSNSNFAQVL